MKIIRWLTGYTQEELNHISRKRRILKISLLEAPNMNPNRKMITGVICGVRVEEIEEPLMQEIRYMDKLIDELAKGKAMEKILREQ